MLLVGSLNWFDADALEGFLDEAAAILSGNDALGERLPYITEALAWRLKRMASVAAWD